MRRTLEGAAGLAVALAVTTLAIATAPFWALWMWLQDRKRAAR